MSSKLPEGIEALIFALRTLILSGVLFVIAWMLYDGFISFLEFILNTNG